MNSDTVTLPANNPLTATLDVGGIWHISIFVGLAFILAYWIKTWFRDGILSTPQKLLWGYILIYCLYLFEFPRIHFGPYNTAFQVTAAQTFAEMFLIPLGVMLLYKKAAQFLPAVIAFELGAIWMGVDGLLIASSFDGAFCAAAIPLIPWWLGLAVIATLVTHHGSTALLIVAVQIVVVILSALRGESIKVELKRKRLWVAVAGIAALFVAAYINSGTAFNSGHRLANYARFMRYWFYGGESAAHIENGPYWPWILFGVGPGSFMWISLELDKYKERHVFLQMHSDWLQSTWELGLVGLGLILTVFYKAARNAWESPRDLAGLFGLGVFCLTYHPFRFFPSAFLAAMLIFSCNRKTYQAHRP